MFMRLSCQYAIIRSTVYPMIASKCDYRNKLRLSYPYAIIICICDYCICTVYMYIWDYCIHLQSSYLYVSIVSICDYNIYMSLLKCNYHIKMRLSDPFAIIMFTSHVIREKSKQISWHWPFKKNGEHIMFFVQYSAVPSAQKKIDSK